MAIIKTILMYNNYTGYNNNQVSQQPVYTPQHRLVFVTVMWGVLGANGVTGDLFEPCASRQPSTVHKIPQVAIVSAIVQHCIPSLRGGVALHACRGGAMGPCNNAVRREWGTLIIIAGKGYYQLLHELITAYHQNKVLCHWNFDKGHSKQ